MADPHTTAREARTDLTTDERIMVLVTELALAQDDLAAALAREEWLTEQLDRQTENAGIFLLGRDAALAQAETLREALREKFAAAYATTHDTDDLSLILWHSGRANAFADALASSEVPATDPKEPA